MLREEVERDLQVLGVRRWRELVVGREKWTGIFRQRAVAPTEEEEVFPNVYSVAYFQRNP